jgi:hypothetical protein
MADFFSRLAERALGVAAVARPALASIFAPGPQVATSPAETAPQPPETVEPGEPSAPLTAAPEIREPIPEARRPDHAVNQPPETTRPEPAKPRIVIARSEPAVTPDLLPRQRFAFEGRPDEQPPEAPAPQSRRLPARVPPFREAEAPVVGTEARAAATPASREPLEFTPMPPIRPHVTIPAITRPEERAPLYGRRSPPPEDRGGATPIVRVSIGRIDVRAMLPAAPPPPAQGTASSETLSLSEYLKQRDRGAR